MTRDQWRFFLNMKRCSCYVAALLLASARTLQTQTPPAIGPGALTVQNADGLRLLVVTENADPLLRIILPGQPTSDRSIEVLFPEHVTGVKHGRSAAEHLYMFRPGLAGLRPQWRRVGRALEYQRDLPGDVRLLARATLEDDGVRIQYEFTNGSAASYDMIYAVTDPRLTGIFHDVRLERTWVHHASGFELLASETPSRLAMPLEQWLPARYLASFSWPVPRERVQRRADGITYYNKSRAVDKPFIATLSADSAWVVASFARNPGNVWSNPQLTCQHVDPQTSLAPGQRATLEMKLLALRGSLDDVLQRAVREREIPPSEQGAFFNSGGVRIRYLEKGSGEPVILLHGFSGSLERHWTTPGVFATLARDYRVIALDLRGHGESDKPHDPAAYGAEMGQDVVRLMDHLGIRRAHLVGYSMGAAIVGQLLAANPERIASATLIGSAPVRRWTVDDDRRAEATAATLEADVPFRDLILRLSPSDEPPPSDSAVLATSRALAARNDVRALAAYNRGRRGHLVTDAQLAAVRVPTLAMVGSADGNLFALNDLKKAMPAMTLVVVEGATHAGQRGILLRADLTTALRKFITSHRTQP